MPSMRTSWSCVCALKPIRSAVCSSMSVCWPGFSALLLAWPRARLRRPLRPAFIRCGAPRARNRRSHGSRSAGQHDLVHGGEAWNPAGDTGSADGLWRRVRCHPLVDALALRGTPNGPAHVRFNGKPARLGWNAGFFAARTTRSPRRPDERSPFRVAEPGSARVCPATAYAAGRPPIVPTCPTPSPLVGSGLGDSMCDTAPARRAGRA